MFDFDYKKVDPNTFLFNIPKSMAEEHDGDYVFMCKLEKLLADDMISYKNNFVLNFQDAEYLFEHFLDRVPWLFNKVYSNNAKLVVVTQAQGIQKQFFFTGLSEFIPITNTINEALEEIQKTKL